MSSTPEAKKRRGKMADVYREGTLVSFWGREAFTADIVRTHFGIVSLIKFGTVHYFSSTTGRMKMNKFAFEDELSRGWDGGFIRVEVF